MKTYSCNTQVEGRKCMSPFFMVEDFTPAPPAAPVTQQILTCAHCKRRYTMDELRAAQQPVLAPEAPTRPGYRSGR